MCNKKEKRRVKKTIRKRRVEDRGRGESKYFPIFQAENGDKGEARA